MPRRRKPWRRRLMILSARIRLHRARDGSNHFAALSSRDEPNAWCDRLRERIAEWAAVDAERAQLLRRSVELPDGLIDNADACERGKPRREGTKALAAHGAGQGSGESAGRRYSVGRRAGKGRGHRGLASRGRGHREHRAAKRGESAVGCVRKRNRCAGSEAMRRSAVDLARKVLHICDDARGKSALLGSLVSDAFSIETLANDPSLCAAVAKQIRASATSVRLAAVEQDRQRLLQPFPGR